MKKAFVISWYFPPVNSSEGLVTFKLLKNSKYNYDVFTQKNNLNWTYGNKEKELTSDNINTIFSKSSTPEEWVKEGIEYFRAHRNEYSYIMSRSMAPESHIMALAIKKEFNDIKWIASFGDPICNNPYRFFTNETSPFSVRNEFEQGEVGFRALLSPKRIIKNEVWNLRHKRYLRKTDQEKNNIALEKETIKNADVVILNNEFQLEHMKKTTKELEDKAIILYHTYDKDYYPKKKKEANDNKIHFSFVGHLDKIRSAKEFFEALKKLNESQEDLKDKISIDFYGDMSNEDKLYLVNNFLMDIVSIKKPVNYLESLEIMKNSYWVLNFDANLGKYINVNIFCPAKVMDYLGSESNIFSITMLDGASADILRKSGEIVVSHSSDEIYIMLKQIIDGNLKVKRNDEYIKNFDAKNVAKKYDEMVEEKILKS